jgi:hypothetical protein
MATWDDVRTIALALPEAVEQSGVRGLKWEVRKKHFAWERPLGKRDQDELGEDAPSEPILGVSTADLAEKEGLIASNPDVFFTIAHFEGYAAVLVLLERIGTDQLREVLTDAWLCRAPKRLAEQYLNDTAE